MKRTRRTALAMLAGSSGLLALDTAGLSRSSAERDLEIDVVSDHEAYLGLVEKAGDEEVETDGVLFEGDSDRYPPATFRVRNQLPESVSVALALEDGGALRFDEVDGTAVDDHRLEISGECENDRLCPGDSSTVSIDFDLTADLPVDERTIETDLGIEADGESTAVDAERTLGLRPGILAVIDLGRFRIVVRKVRDEKRDSRDYRIVVELMDTQTEKWADPISIDAVSVPRLRLKISDYPRGSATSEVTDETIETADDVDYELTDETDDSETAQEGNRSTADDSTDFIVELEPDEADPDDVEEIQLSLNDAR